MPTARVTVTLPAELVDDIDQRERNRSGRSREGGGQSHCMTASSVGPSSTFAGLRSRCITAYAAALDAGALPPRSRSRSRPRACL